jgi:hypothetical protein
MPANRHIVKRCRVLKKTLVERASSDAFPLALF